MILKLIIKSIGINKIDNVIFIADFEHEWNIINKGKGLDNIDAKKNLLVIILQLLIKLNTMNLMFQRFYKWKEYNYDGIIEYEGDHLNGKRNRNGKEYDLNDNLKYEGEYIYCERYMYI